MYYRKALTAAGFNPDDINDATKSDEFILHITAKELKGSEIGSPTKCAGAKACINQQHATFAWIGASMAILGFHDGRALRFLHNGQLPKNHDRGMFVIGDYKFSHVPEGRRLRIDHGQNKSVRPTHKSKGVRKGIVLGPEPSLAAQMRRGQEVKY